MKKNLFLFVAGLALFSCGEEQGPKKEPSLDNISDVSVMRDYGPHRPGMEVELFMGSGRHSPGE